jgi:hypothetical protein
VPLTLEPEVKVPLAFQPDPESNPNLQCEMTSRDRHFLKELTQCFSRPTPQSGSTRAPRIAAVRRSPVRLIRNSELPKDNLRAFVPELNISLGHVTHRSNGHLEFSKKVTKL